MCVCVRRTAASDVDCCCLLTVLGSFLFSQRSWRHSFSNRTFKRCETTYFITSKTHTQYREKHNDEPITCTHCSELSAAGDQEDLSCCSVGVLLQLLHLGLTERDRERQSERQGGNKRRSRFIKKCVFKLCFRQSASTYLLIEGQIINIHQ